MSGNAPDTEVLNWGRISRDLPQAIADTLAAMFRTNRYGELVTAPAYPGKQQMADECSSFVVLASTPGTTLAYGAAGTQTTFSDTVPFLIVENTESDPNGRTIFLDYLKLIQIGGTAPATTTSIQAAAVIDAGNRFPTSAGTTYTDRTAAIQCTNTRKNAKSIAKVLFPNGAVATIPASTGQARQVGRAQLKGGPTLLLDEYSIHFGAVDPPSSGGYLTTVGAYQARMPELAIAPGHFGIIHLWFPGGATNPFTFEAELKITER